MAIDLVCYASKPLSEVDKMLDCISTEHLDLFSSQFLISKVFETNEIQKEITLEYGLHASCWFLVRLNDKSVAGLLSSVEVILKNAMGDNNVVIFLNDEIRR
jgi:hypothetical protein